MKFYPLVVGAAMVAGIGCGDSNHPAGGSTGDVQIFILPSPDDVAAIHVAVTGPDFSGSIDTDLVKQSDQSWLGSVLDVPPGSGRTLTAEAYDGDNANTFEGIATNVTVSAGELTDVTVDLKPTADTEPGTNTPPHFTTLRHPDSMLSTATATFTAIAADPDAGTHLTYTWSAVQGGGSFDTSTFSNQLPGAAVMANYTPVSGFTGFALIEVDVTDGTATTTTTFPIAIGAGVVPQINFDVPPDITITSVQRQAMMPNDSSQIQFTLTNPVTAYTPATMHVTTTWTDSCGGSFDAAPEQIDINQGDTASRTVTYSSSSSSPSSVEGCQLKLNVTNDTNVQLNSLINLWIDPPMAIFMSSAAVPGNAFSGRWQDADAFCQGLADQSSAAPAGRYKALISFNYISSKDRLIDAPFIRVDGTPVARNKAELYSINLLNAIRTDEAGNFNGVSAVFTGTNGDGSLGTNCNNWTSNDGGDNSTAGINATSANPNWTNSGTFTCSAQLPIYCAQQPST